MAYAVAERDFVLFTLCVAVPFAFLTLTGVKAMCASTDLRLVHAGEGLSCCSKV